jgi:hypothetical protein
MPKKVALSRSVAQATPLIRKFAVAIGIGLTVSALRFDILKQLQNVGANYWTDWSTRSLLVVLIAICTGLLITAVLLEDDRFLGYVSGFGAILLGFFLFVPVAVGSGHLGDLAVGPKLAVAGSALIVLGAFPTQALHSWQRSRGRNSLRLYVTWLAAAIGSGLVIVSLGRQVAASLTTGPNSVGVTGELPRYWTSVTFSGGHALGIVMLSLAILVIVLAVGDAVLRAPVLGRWALAVSLLLLGFTLYYPFSLSNMGAFSIGGGLGLEGAALASVASLAAVSVERGRVESKALNICRLVAVLGIGLALAGTYTSVFKGTDGGTFWVDGTLGGFPPLLSFLGGLSLIASFVVRSRWPLFSVSILGWLLAGYFGTYVIEAAPNHFATLGPATWLGMSGGALMGLSTILLRSPAAWKRRSPAMTRRQLILWLATAIGTGVLLISLWLPTEAQPGGPKISHTYWNSASDHSQGVVMLTLAALTLIALVGVLVSRLAVLRAWAVGTSLVLLGISLFIPVLEAFQHLGALRSGAWLALVGSLLAGAAAVALALPDQLAQAKSDEVDGAAPPRPRPPLPGKKARVPEMRRRK